MKLVVIFLSLWVACIAHAEEIFPIGCKPLVIKDELILVPAGEPRLIMIHNLSAVDLWITHPTTDSNANAGWSSRLQAGNWSALALDDKAFQLSCIESRPGHEQQIPCAQVVATCQWPTTARPEKPSGIFWAGENRSLAPLTAYIERRGFVVPSSTQ